MRRRVVAPVAVVLAILAGTAQAASESAPAPLPVLQPATVPTTSLVEADVAALLSPLLRSPALGGRASVALADLTTGDPIWESFGARAVPPASVLKLVTAASALTTLGPQTRLTTRIVLTGDRVVLVGAGDPSLARTQHILGSADGFQLRVASIAQLAALTATALDAKGRSKIRLSYDASLFSGSRVAPGWSPSFVRTGVISPVSALSVDAGRLGPDEISRSIDPARTAAHAFAIALQVRGIKVRGIVTSRTRAANATELAAVSSPTVGELVEYMLTTSDNDFAEALAHLAGAKSGDGTFAGGVTAARMALRRLGVDAAPFQFTDGSGLSASDRQSATATVDLLVALTKSRAASAVWAGLPTAAATGTLADRFTGMARQGRGVVRAKTGTLTGVSNIAGITTTSGGTVVAFALFADRVVDKVSAERALDRICATIASL